MISYYSSCVPFPKTGDEIRLAKTAFRVSIVVPAVCKDCATEIPEANKARCQIAPGVYQCAVCSPAVRAIPVAAASVSHARSRVCPKCGRDVSREMGDHRQGKFVCAACKANPLEIMGRLLELARSGDKGLTAIKGYQVLRELGRGGMGAVYLARHERTGEQVALKMMLPQVAMNERAKQLFLREIENTRVLKHPNVVSLCEAGCSQGVFFLTLDYCDGGSVAQWMGKPARPLPIGEGVDIALQVLHGLEYAHAVQLSRVQLMDGSSGKGQGLVHRDLKPHNIFLHGAGRSRVAKVGDFGLAKAFDLAGLSGLSCTGALGGTPVFMPRQQVVDFKFCQPEVDVWAAAASLYYMRTGHYPRDFPKGKDPWMVVLLDPPVPIRQRVPGLPRRLAEVIDQALVDQSGLHFKTAAALRRALEGVT